MAIRPSRMERPYVYKVLPLQSTNDGFGFAFVGAGFTPPSLPRPIWFSDFALGLSYTSTHVLGHEMELGIVGCEEVYVMGAIKLSIDQLLLDFENPRIEGAANQRDALQKILDDQEEKLFALAEDIADKGLSPIDRILVLREKEGSVSKCWTKGNIQTVTGGMI